MSIPVLAQVYDEVRRLAIAGSVVAGGDFRLKKLLPPLEQAGQKAPVFAKVAQAVSKLVESTEKTSADALLELSTLVNAILYTQGETGLAGNLEPIKSIDLGQQQTQTSARTLKPLLEALSTTGSGRMEIIKDAHERGAFRDLRLIRPALAALDDPYAEIADFIADKVLPMYGNAILPDLREKFDPKGRGGHVRRLTLMHRLDSAGSRELVKQSLDEGSKEVRIVAIECLGSDPEDLAFLIEQAKSKAKDVRAAALKALGKCKGDTAVQSLCAALQSADIELAVEPVRASRDPTVLAFVLAEAKMQFNALLESKEKDKAKLGKQVSRMLALLECLRDRDDKQTEALLLDMFARRETLAAVKGEPSGKDVEQQLVFIMSAGPKKVQSALVDAHAALADNLLAAAFVAACRSRKPAEVFELFSPYLTAKFDEKKKKRDPAFAKRQVIVEVLTASGRRWYHRLAIHVEDEFDVTANLDPRWLDLAVRQEQLDLVQALAVPGHAAANKLLSKAFDEQLKKAKEGYELGSLLRTMVRVQHPAATDAVIAAISKHAKGTHGYGVYWLGQLIPELPKESLPKLEAWLPTLPEKVIDQILDYVTELKN